MRASERPPRPAIIEGDIARIPLGVGAKGGYTLVDKDDAWIAQYKCRLVNGYAFAWVNSRDERIHRLVTEAKKGQSVDHINHDRLDNRKTNLRVCTHSENLRNMKTPADNTSGYKGVSLLKSRDKYAAYINVNRQRHRLGYFDTPEEAARAYNAKAIELHGDFASLNSVE